MKDRTEGPLERREVVAVQRVWVVVAEQFRDTSGVCRWDVYAEPSPDRWDIDAVRTRYAKEKGSDLRHRPDWLAHIAARTTPRVPEGPNVHDDHAAEVTSLVAMCRTPLTWTSKQAA